jgi:site-specific DNA recombinase
LKAVLSDTAKDPYGQPLKIGTLLQIDQVQAPIIAEIFERHSKGESAQRIACDLNARGVPSAGSTWKRVTRRGDKWMNSSVRVILRSPLYKGEQGWNRTKFVKNPGSNKYLRLARPESEHVVNQIESLRIVSDALWQRARIRTHALRNDDPRLKVGGKTRFLLSSLLHCAVCNSAYVICDRYSYACSSFVNGGACTNNVRVNRKSIEKTILGPVIATLKDPARVEAMAQMMERQFAKKMQARAARATTFPRIASVKMLPDGLVASGEMLLATAPATMVPPLIWRDYGNQDDAHGTG